MTEQAITKHIEDSEKRFRALVTATSDIVYSMSADWKLMHALQGRGVLSDTFEPIDDWMPKYIPKDEHQFIQQAIKNAITSKSIFELEHKVLQADGTVGWTFSRAVPILNEKNEIIEWFGAASNISKRRRIEEDLQKTKEEMEVSKRLYEAITDSTPDLIYVFDRNYKFTYANKALLTMWGRTWPQSEGQRLIALGYEPWHAAMHEREIDEVVATKKSVRGEVSFPHATLGKRIYDYIFAPVLNSIGEVEAVAGTTRDISDLKNAEQALVQSEEQFRTLTQSLPQLIWTADKDGYCDFFNQQWYDYTGSTLENSRGNGWAQYVHADHRNRLYARWQESLRTGHPIDFEFQLKSKNSDYQWFYVLGNPIRNDSGEITKWVSTLTNIQEQKAAEEQLEQMVIERTAELKRSNDDLTQFAHVASHDLKEPTRKIKMFISRLQNDPTSHLSENAKIYIEKIQSATNRMYTMIEGVLNYSSVRNLEQKFTLVDLNGIIESIKIDLELLIQQKHAQIHSSGDLPTVNGAPVLLYQLFYNLINNSLKFAKHDVASEIYIDCKVENIAGKTMFKIELRDNGIGFSNEHAEVIFETFSRLHSKDQYEGTGLGLALCKKIAERHGGHISATSVESEGTVVTIYLPHFPAHFFAV